MGYIIYFQFLGGKPDDYLLGISPAGIGTIGMLVNFTVAFVVNLFSPPPPQHVQDMVESIRIPTGSDEVTGTHSRAATGSRSASCVCWHVMLPAAQVVIECRCR